MKSSALPMAPPGSGAPWGAGPNLSERASSVAVESANRKTAAVIGPVMVESPITRFRFNSSTSSGGTNDTEPDPTNAMPAGRPATGVS